MKELVSKIQEVYATFSTDAEYQVMFSLMRSILHAFVKQISTRLSQTLTKARNISRNTTIIVPAHNIPAFKPSKAFVERMKSDK